MAAVWAARHRGAHGFTKIVALKTMLPELSDEADFQQMFLREARVASRIRHPNVVETLDLGEEDGLLYLVMEWIDGETLGTVMKAAAKEGGVSIALGLKIIVDACAGVHAAHELCDEENGPLGLVHRDVSPPNVLVSYSGQVKLADFGVAKTLELNNVLTQTGQVKGKFRYMAPEQLSGAPLDRRADIFALGINLYQLTTGRHPWPADNAMMTMRKILSDPPVRPSSIVDGYPEELERIVLKALAREPEDRFQSATEMSLVLEELARESGLLATTREVGAYVSRLLETRGAARREVLRKATREADARVVGDGSLRQIDEAWEGIAADGPCTPALRTTLPEGGSMRPWTREPSVPPKPEEAASTPAPFSMHIAAVASLVRLKGWKRAAWVGGAALLMLIAYALGGRHPSDVAAAASGSSRDTLRATARRDAVDEITTESATDVAAAAAAASAEAARVTAPHASSPSLPSRSPVDLRQPAPGSRRGGFRVPPSEATRRAPIDSARAPGPKAEQDPDVGF